MQSIANEFVEELILTVVNILVKYENTSLLKTIFRIAAIDEFLHAADHFLRRKHNKLLPTCASTHPST